LLLTRGNASVKGTLVQCFTLEAANILLAQMGWYRQSPFGTTARTAKEEPVVDNTKNCCFCHPVTRKLYNEKSKKSGDYFYSSVAATVVSKLSREADMFFPQLAVPYE
jgi:hypothetical protein